MVIMIDQVILFDMKKMHKFIRLTFLWPYWIAERVTEQKHARARIERVFFPKWRSGERVGILVERVNDVVVKVAQAAVAVKVHLVGEDCDVRVLVRVLRIKCRILQGDE